MRIKDADIDFLLGREACKPEPSLMSKNIKDRVVMVTGAGGSIGSELCRQIARQQPKMLVMYEISEYALYSIQIELMRTEPDVVIKPILGSVTHENRMDAVMRQFNVQTVYHAAAYKHVPMVEYNQGEGLYNNFFGTVVAADCAWRNNVETFVLVSTDKAVRPTNVMGASKRMAEMYVQSLADLKPTFLKYSMVRFGNVLGSSGSVIPLFLEHIARNEPLPITDPEITRYFMSIPEAAQLVIQAGAMAEGGEVFVLDMGNPVKIIDLARKMLDFYGKSEDNLVITGLRPGEKLYEELLIGNNVLYTEHQKIFKAQEDFENLRQMQVLSQLVQRHYDNYSDVGFETLRDLVERYVSGCRLGPNVDHLNEYC